MPDGVLIVVADEIKRQILIEAQSPMTTPLSKKLGIKRGTRSILIDAPTEVVRSIGLPNEDVASKLAGEFGYIHVFVMHEADLDTMFPKLKGHLAIGGMLWVSWPKGKPMGSNLTLKEIIGIGYGHGLVESKTISVDDTWSAIKFTFPKEGKQYNNSYGQLAKRNRQRVLSG